eukprot:TRINITY_DN5946_c0_g1_i9.p2 TRINITY_DN5946_c0_g1~~TRINITY_DN5946_c0_g1_i9.p2  ORF type:complete len:115 (-),score=30.86 TRINITY_DN5946_c0_g1_i9:113-457(-)
MATPRSTQDVESSGEDQELMLANEQLQRPGLALISLLLLSSVYQFSLTAAVLALKISAKTGTNEWKSQCWAITLWAQPPCPRLSLIHISEPTRLLSISYAVFCLKKKKKKHVSY